MLRSDVLAALVLLALGGWLFLLFEVRRLQREIEAQQGDIEAQLEVNRRVRDRLDQLGRFDARGVHTPWTSRPVRGGKDAAS